MTLQKGHKIYLTARVIDFELCNKWTTNESMQVYRYVKDDQTKRELLESHRAECLGRMKCNLQVKIQISLKRIFLAGGWNKLSLILPREIVSKLCTFQTRFYKKAIYNYLDSV